MKKIAFITTARSEYNASRWVMKAINDDPELELQVWVGGTHWGDNESFKEIVTEPYYMVPVGHYDALNTKYACRSLGDTVSRTSEYIIEQKPDMIIINGDRIELMGYVLAASIHGIPIAHIGGGDITDGSLDNETRYAISRYAHLHFVSDEQAAENLIKSGEEPWRVSVTGQCGLENIIRTEKLSLEETSKAIGLDLSIPTAVCIYYPSRELNVSIEQQIGCILNALHETDTQTVFIYPCAEIGADIIRDKIDKYCKTHDNCKAFANLENQLFQSLLKHVKFMMGNSSCGIVEMPFVPGLVINVGNRQKGRYQKQNIINCDYDIKLLRYTIERIDQMAINRIRTVFDIPSKKIIQAIKENIDKPELLHKRILL